MVSNVPDRSDHRLSVWLVLGQTMNTWMPSSVMDFDVTHSEALEDEWPTVIQVRKWERNAEGERRVRDRRTYRLVEADDD